MELTEQKVYVESYTPDIAKHIEHCGRVAYRSQPTNSSTEHFIASLIVRGHESVLEHGVITVFLKTDRGISHEIVRHRLASYTQESTRYCNYGKEHISFIKPAWFDYAQTGFYDAAIITVPPPETPVSMVQYNAEVMFLKSCLESEARYKQLLAHGWKAEQARQVLNNATATTLAMTANVREWRHVIKLRCAKQAHPNMQQLMHKVLEAFLANAELNSLFKDLVVSTEGAKR